MFNFKKKEDIMKIKYVLSQKRNPQDPEGPKKWYATVKSTQEVTLKQLGKEITQRCTVNYADTLAVLESLTQMLAEHLGNNEIVKLGDFGTFYITIGSEGAETEEKFHRSMVRDPKVRFRSGSDLKNMIRLLDFEKWEDEKDDEEAAAGQA